METIRLLALHLATAGQRHAARVFISSLYRLLGVLHHRPGLISRVIGVRTQQHLTWAVSRAWTRLLQRT